MNAPIQAAQIRLQSLQVSECHFKATDTFNPSTTTTENVLNLDHRTVLVNENKKLFIVEFQAHIFNGTNTFTLDVLFRALFESSVEVDDQFLKSNFVTLNAPAIAFPFLRSFITTLTANAGFNPLILPAINFARTMKTKMDKPKQ